MKSYLSTLRTLNIPKNVIDPNDDTEEYVSLGVEDCMKMVIEGRRGGYQVHKDIVNHAKYFYQNYKGILGTKR